MEIHVSKGLHFLMLLSHLALVWMVALYTIKIVQLLKKPAPPEKAELKGDRTSGAIYSLFNVLMPWGMESTRTRPFMYVEFMIFHIAVALTIGLTVFIPFTPWLLTPAFCTIIIIFQALAFLIGLHRIYRRTSEEHIRIISSFDDFFAIFLLTGFFGIGVLAMYQLLLGRPETVWMWIFFAMVTFFIIYVPFSKISHYVLYPFGRWMYGQIFGGRGILNQKAK